MKIINDFTRDFQTTTFSIPAQIIIKLQFYPRCQFSCGVGEDYVWGELVEEEEDEQRK